MDVHVTELEVFRTCRLYWDFSYRQNLKPKTEASGGPLWVGTGIHYGLACFYRDRIPPKEGLISWEKYSTPYPLMEEILEHYYQQYHSDLDHWEVIRVETPVRVHIPGTHSYLVGTFDLQIKDLRTQKVWIVDHKTRTYFDEPDSIELNEQITGYLWVARALGENVTGVIWNEIRKASPQSNPRMSEFFRRTQVLRAPSELQKFEEDLRLTVLEMESPSLPIYPNFSLQCSRWKCSYLPLCRARRQGGDVESLKEVLYVKDSH